VGVDRRFDTKDLRYRFNNRMIRGGQAVPPGAAFILPQVSRIPRPGKWIFA
jgi:hypothetical protein